jgi:hypothetical protein
MKNNKNEIINGEKSKNGEEKKGCVSTILFIFPYIHVVSTESHPLTARG